MNKPTPREQRYLDYLSADPRLNDKVGARKIRPGKLLLNALLLVSVVACFLIAGSVDADDDTDDEYLGQLSANPYDADSTSNPYGRYGSKYSPDSINNPYGAGSPYRSDSPNNPYGEGLEIYGE